MKKLSLSLLGGLFVVALSVGAAQAVPPFAAEFKAEYVKDGSDLAKAVLNEQGKVACTVCHQPGDDKKKRNAYGEALHKYLNKKDAKNIEKIHKAFKDVEGSKPAGGDKSFGDLIKAGKSPGG